MVPKFRLAALALTGALGGAWSGEAARVRLDRGAFHLGGEPFLVRGVAYLPGGAMPGLGCVYARDLPLMAAMGANTVRTYGLLPEGERVFSPLLESTGLYWLAGFPLSPYYDPAQPIGAQKTRILHDLRSYAQRFRAQRRIIAYVVGQDVVRDYGSKFAGRAEEFYQLIGEAAAMLREIDPQLLTTTSVSAPEEMAREAPGLDFWSLDGPAGAAALEAARARASRPVLVSEYAGGDAAATARLTAAMESGGGLLGEVYASFVGDEQGIFAARASGQPGLDSLRPREVFYALAGLWHGSYPAPWAETQRPRLTLLDDGAPGPTSPGALVRLAGRALLHPTMPYTDDRWPLHLATSCLCVEGAPARLRLLSPDEITAQIPPGVEPGERTAVFFRAGVASNILPIEVRQLSAETRPGPVLEARARRAAATRAAAP